jgi:sulfur-carrier protein adenylyltransferase/sulfurtransferase
MHTRPQNSFYFLERFLSMSQCMASPPNVPQITVQQLQAQLQIANPLLLLDVREDHEVALCALPNAVHIPMAKLSFEWEAKLPQDKPIVVYCHKGGRSAMATTFLQRRGLTQALNLTGGIDAWAANIDLEMARY